jgi:hypothetical protein
MATIRRSWSGWQALIRKKQSLWPRSKTFTSQAAAKLWANAVEGSLKRPEQLDQPTPQILKEAIDLFIEGPLQEHRSGYNEQYPLRAMDLIVQDIEEINLERPQMVAKLIVNLEQAMQKGLINNQSSGVAACAKQIISLAGLAANRITTRDIEKLSSHMKKQEGNNQRN